MFPLKHLKPPLMTPFLSPPKQKPRDERPEASEGNSGPQRNAGDYVQMSPSGTTRKNSGKTMNTLGTLYFRSFCDLRLDEHLGVVGYFPF